ncbi:MAG: MFS transporter [Betaproteobacteria bacterium]|nr:MFS transporter [Betaproteobacteria bacterium]
MSSSSDINGNQTVRAWSWYLFDAGNSAHALLVSTVGFALYFRQYLFAANAQADTLWALITAIVLAISAAISPFITSWLYHHQIRWIGLGATTIGCVFFTVLLGFDISPNAGVVVAIYMLSAIGYYVALPIYTSYLREASGSTVEKTSSTGWAVGYVGGIVVALIALGMGSLSAPVAEQPHRFREIFVLAGVFNLILSLPLLYWTWRDRGESITHGANQWQWDRVLGILRRLPGTMRLLVSYWMVGEAATIALYFTAIFLGTYVGLPIAKIFALTLLVQFIAAIATWLIGNFAEKYGSDKLFRITCWLWIAVPPLLWAVKHGVVYLAPLVLMGLVLGAHHTLVRAEIVRLSETEAFDKDEKGSLFGFLEVTGRVSSILGPLIVGLLTFVVDLSEALLVATVFPIIALQIIRRYKWQVGS